MLRPAQDACNVYPMVENYRTSEAVQSASGVINDEGSGEEIFACNYVPLDMEMLFPEPLLRINRRSDEVVFDRPQPIGVGRPRSPVALDLLPRHLHLRPLDIANDLARRPGFGETKIAPLHGRNAPKHPFRTVLGAPLAKAHHNRKTRPSALSARHPSASSPTTTAASCSLIGPKPADAAHIASVLRDPARQTDPSRAANQSHPPVGINTGFAHSKLTYRFSRLNLLALPRL